MVFTILYQVKIVLLMLFTCRMTSNTLEIKELLHQESFKDVDVLLPYPDEGDIMPITTTREMMRTVSE